MEELLSKLESYRILNFLLPGALFIYACRQLGIYNFNTENLFFDAFLSYFIGMTISRIGSIFLEKPLDKIGKIKRCPYSDYLEAEQHDKKINVLQEEANGFRTIVATVVCFAVAYSTKKVNDAGWLTDFATTILLMLSILALYGWAYLKQIRYVIDRVNRFKLNSNNE
jgi:hypothetical protein